jgi:HD-GYP domain-containing protein (c-di-GMP phosphodiesterase class II)
VTNTLVTGREYGPTSLPREDSPTFDTAWDILERFGQSMQTCDETVQQVRLVLTSVRDSLGADVVYWHPGNTGEEHQAVGTPTLNHAWSRTFTEHVLVEAPSGQGQLLRSFLDPGAKPSSPWPVSAALVRLSKSKQVWLGALSFDSRRQFQSVDLKLMMLARRMLLNHRQHVQTHQRLRDSLLGLIHCLTAAIDAKDPYTWGHSERVARMGVRLGKEMGVPETFLSDIYLAGLLHDVGKIGVRDSVLQKAGKLTPDEMAHIQEHPVIGDRLVSNVKALQHLRPGVRNHHERWDGAGYPDCLGGEDIPLLARILAVADSCDAMMSARPYRSALETNRIETVIRGGAGSQWDPRIVEHFLACKHELYAVCERGIGESITVAVDRALSVATLTPAD